MSHNTIPSDEIINKTKAALEQNNFTVLITQNGQEAKNRVLELIPEGSEVMTMTSATVDAIGLSAEVNESGKYNSVRAQMAGLDSKTQSRQIKVLGAAPAFSIGSVHALTHDGKAVIASATGSQLGGYAYGSDRVVWVVGAQKITENLETAMARIYDYVLPLESERARKAYGAPGSSVNKLLIVNKESVAGRITIIIIKEQLGF